MVTAQSNLLPPQTILQTDGPLSLSSIDPKEILKISISGIIYEVSASVLARFPKTLLGNPEKRILYFNTERKEYHFERHSPSFDAILYYYQTGGFLYKPGDVSKFVFERECDFFGIDLGPAPGEEDHPELNKKSPFASEFQAALYQVLEHQNSSILARIFGIITVLLILLSVITFCLETVPELREDHHKLTAGNASATSNGSTVDLQSLKDTLSRRSDEEYEDAIGSFFADDAMTSNILFILETVCILWFSAELILRFIATPSKKKFIRNFLNVIDVVAIFPFYVNLVLLALYNQHSALSSLAILRVLRLARVLRVLKISRHSKGLQILGRTIASCHRELTLLMFFLIITLVVSGSVIYVLEVDVNDQIQETLTTVGYGDVLPITIAGKIVAGVCAVTGVLVLALPITVIVSAFKRFYELEAQAERERSAKSLDALMDAEAEENGIGVVLRSNRQRCRTTMIQFAHLRR